MTRQPWQVPACAFALLLLGASCSHTPTDEDPAGALRLFLDAMDRSRSDPSARPAAFELLTEESRTDLTRRARLATALAGGRTLQPYELLVPGRFRFRFSPRPADGFEVQSERDHATVVVHGHAAGERAEVHMRREQGHWRLSMDFDAGDVAPSETSLSAPVQ